MTTGLLITPWPLAIAVAAPIGGRLVERWSPGLLGGIGLAVLAVGQGVLALLPAHPSIAMIVAAMVTSGFGFGLFQTPNNRAMLGLGPVDRSGAAAGMLATARLFGQTVGAVLVALVFRLDGPATNLALALAAGLAAFAALLSLSRMASR